MNKNIVWHEGQVTYEDRCSLLQQKGLVIWFTGLSGSGKSTLAVELERALTMEGRLVYRLDGDNIRHGLNKDLGFTDGDRKENIRRIAEVASLFRDAGVITLASFISPFVKMREQVKEVVGADNFIEVYVKCSLEECKKRDPKGLYKKALAGEIAHFTGITSTYEEPPAPSVVVDTGELDIVTAVAKVASVVKTKINNPENL